MAGNEGGNSVVRRVPRLRSGTQHGARIVLRRKFRVMGQIFNRLMFIHENNPTRYLEGTGTIPMASDNLFDRGVPFQMDRSDFAMGVIELELRRGDRMVERVVGRMDGAFTFDTELTTGVRYKLVATLSGDRFYPERITIPFRLSRLPATFDDREELRLQSTHEINTAASTARSRPRWTRVDREEITATVRGGVNGSGSGELWFAGSRGSVVFNTFALDVEHISQHLSPIRGPVNYHTFTHEGRRYSVGLHHLCLATCCAMTLRYYGFFTEESGADTVKRVVEAAARYWFTNGASLRPAPGQPVPTLDATARDPSGVPIVKFTDGQYPHNLTGVLIPAAAALMTSGGRGTGRYPVIDGPGDLFSQGAFPNIKQVMTFGMLPWIGDDLPGSWNHARLCHGIVVDHTGRVVRAYGNDPWRADRWEIRTDGSQSDLGWMLLGRKQTQAELCADPLWSGGDVPAPRRLASGMDR